MYTKLYKPLYSCDVAAAFSRNIFYATNTSFDVFEANRNRRNQTTVLTKVIVIFLTKRTSYEFIYTFIS